MFMFLCVRVWHKLENPPMYMFRTDVLISCRRHAISLLLIQLCRKCLFQHQQPANAIEFEFNNETRRQQIIEEKKTSTANQPKHKTWNVI